MKKKNKICFVIIQLRGGGQERFMSELANFAAKSGYEVSLVFLIDHIPLYELHPNIKTVFPSFPYNAEGNKLNYWTKIIGYLRSTISKIKPDTVFSIPQDYCILTILALLGKRIPVYISQRNSPNLRISLVKRILRIFFYPLAQGIVAQTTQAREHMRSQGILNKNIIVIPNPLKKIKNYKNEIKSKNIVLNIGRYVFEKNQKELIEIFNDINEPNWELHLYGEGPLKEELKEMVKGYNKEKIIKVNDFTDNIDKVMATAKIFAFTSIYEGFPNSLNEAMAYPMLCISYDCAAGPRDIIDNMNNGILVDVGDREEFKKQLYNSMNNSELRERLAANAIFNREKFSMNKIGELYLKFILGRVSEN